MRKRFCALYCALIIFALRPGIANAQSYIDFSKFAGGSSADSSVKMLVVNNETYVVATTTSANFPVTNGSVYQGKKDLVATKYSSSGTILYSTYLGGLGDEYLTEMKVAGGEMYILGTSDSINYPVTNGTTFKGLTDVIVTKLGTNGNIVFSTYLGGSGIDYAAAGELQLVSNELFIAGTTGSSNFPVTTGTYKGGLSDGFITRFNGSTGTIMTSRFFGGNKSENITTLIVDNGSVYVSGTTESTNVPVTIGNPITTGGRHVFISKLNLVNLNIIYSRYLGGNVEDFGAATKLLDGEIHITGFTYSPDFPVTNGTTPSGNPADPIDGFFTRLNTDGSIAFSTYLSSPGLDIMSGLNLSSGNVYLNGLNIDLNSGAQQLILYKINSNGSFGYTKKIDLSGTSGMFPVIKTLNDEVYLAGITGNAAYPVTNGSQFYNGGTAFFTHINASGEIVYSSFLGKMNKLLPFQYVNNKFYLLGSTDANSYAVTDSSKTTGANDHLLIILNTDGSNFFSSYIGGSANEYATSMEISNNDIYFSGKTYSADYPVTDNILNNGNGDAFVTKLSFCPTTYDVSNDTLSEKTQTVCKYGLAKKIAGKKIFVPANTLPSLYLNGTATYQKTIEATYQWQVADAIGGPFTNIPGATLKDYTPVIGSLPQYYRRQSFTAEQCGGTFIHNSDTASVFVNEWTAPTVNPGGPFITCPGSTITLGGSPTATGGNPPYVSYSWDMGAASVSNPDVAPANSTIYTLTVTDNLGCQQQGQTVVFSFAAEAGADKSNCAGTPVKIGAPLIPGITGLQYNWLPNIAIDNMNIAQPMVNPLAPTDYILTLTVDKTGGGTCFTKDTVKVSPVAAPTTTDFAGPDKVICLGDIASIGTAAENDFSYTWGPGNYLTSNTTSVTTYSPGNILMPMVNPAVIYLTAQKGGCTFTDHTVVSTIESRPGITGCGPRLVGLPDRTPDINETYQWIKISGPGNFTGATNLPQVPVSASIGGTTLYGLLVSYQGHACFNQVSVPETCQGCQVIIYVDAKYKCPSFGINGNDVTLTAVASVGDATYQWSPQVGLSDYNSSQVKLTDNVPRTYTVTATSIYDPSVSCSETITVNNPAFSIPVFPASDAFVCANTPTSIGSPPVAGYHYEWTGSGLSNNFISNPVATINTQTTYPVRIFDDNGCELLDTVVVQVQNVSANAGPDWSICTNGIATLGTPAQPNTTYNWEPSSSPWQNGTDQHSAQPQVLAVTDLVFTVTATTSAGCITSDDVNISINNSPTVPNAPDVVYCAGPPVMIGSPALPGVTYQWTPTAGLNNATIAQPLASPSGNTTYTLIATFAGSCALPATDQVFVKASNAAFDMPDKVFCPGSGAVALGTTAPAGMASYNWQPAALVSNSLIANPSTQNPPPSVATTFTLTVRNTDGCEASDNITISPATLKPDAGADRTTCKGSSTQIGSATNTGGPSIAYSWDPVTNLSDATSMDPVFTATTAGSFTYILTKTDNSISCSSKDTIVINVTEVIIPPINSPTICKNSCTQIGTAPVSGIQYQWIPQAGLSNPAIANPVACAGTNTLNYTLTATDINGCSASRNVVIGVNNIPAAQLSIPAVTACVGSNTASFSPLISPSGNYSFLWSPDDGTLSNIYIQNPAIIVAIAGTKLYTLTVTDNVTGCSNSSGATLIANDCPAFESVGDRFWFDLNNNGIQDAGEPGVSGMNIRLYNSSGFNIASATTDANGLYSFANISPGNDYYILFAKPAGYDFTLQNIGGAAAANNSKADAEGRSTNFNVVSGTAVENIDAGIRPTGTTPVTLLSFTGTLRNEQVLLNWQTTAEYNNHYFDVEKSSDGLHFISIGKVNGHGTTVLPSSYSLIDGAPFSGLNYYRLKQVDFNGSYTYSNVVTVRVTNTLPVTVYYNNQNNSIQLSFSSRQPKTHMNLYADNGQLIQSLTSENFSNYTIPLTVLARGIYLLQVVNEKMSYTEKLFISK